MNRAEYEEYLRSPTWRLRRADAIKRAGGKCEDCRAEYRLRGAASGYMMWPAQEVHHLTYERVGNERPEDLVALCERHHLARHGVDPERDRELAAMRAAEAATPEWEPYLSQPEPIINVAAELGVTAREIPPPAGFNDRPEYRPVRGESE
jgi:hypothetical protein